MCQQIYINLNNNYFFSLLSFLFTVNAQIKPPIIAGSIMIYFIM
ncbi:hypothetical protein AC3_A0557 [Clostridium perfringens E str. JGS1987]|uniref:Uncharacterized protein n=1 Tax=Clostridium perfringens E str. JGS1987 TaxID=451755 RepID=B1BSX5_CLOPF|nr:hypothetical protein AC3_A0557 [Clostridium perfringens E str. JGS1987]